MHTKRASAILLMVALGIAVWLPAGPARCDDATSSEDVTAFNPDEVTIEEIVAAWNARHDRVQSLHFEFTQDLVLVRQDELRLHCDELLVIDGERYFREMEGQRWNLHVNAPVDETLIQLDDGERSLNFYGRPEQSDRLHSVGKIRTIGHDTYFSAGFSTSLFPIFHTFRIRQPWFLASTADGWSLTPREGQIDGRRRVIVECRREADAGRTFELWIDTTRDYIALRQVLGAEGQIISQLDIEYEPDAIAGWAPRRWVQNLYSSSAANRLLETTVFEVISSEFNQPVSEEYFEFEFPAGTVVYDETQGGRSFLVREDGNREITEDERLRGSRYTDWATTESGEALLPPSSNAAIWVWLLVVVVFGIGWWIFRLRKRIA